MWEILPVLPTVTFIRQNEFIVLITMYFGNLWELANIWENMRMSGRPAVALIHLIAFIS